MKPIIVNLEAFFFTAKHQWKRIVGLIVFVVFTGNLAEFVIEAWQLTGILPPVIGMVILLSPIVWVFWKKFWPEARQLREDLAVGDRWKRPGWSIRQAEIERMEAPRRAERARLDAERRAREADPNRLRFRR